jgi:predicted small secreted protein
MRVKAGFWLALAFLFGAAPLLSACNTVHGVGQDLTAAGKGIENTADKVGGGK